MAARQKEMKAEAESLNKAMSAGVEDVQRLTKGMYALCLTSNTWTDQRSRLNPTVGLLSHRPHSVNIRGRLALGIE